MPDPRILDTAADLKARLETERKGVPFLFFRDGEGMQRIVTLDPADDELSVGRDAECDFCFEWDARVSRLHARIERSGGSWAVYDGGLSRNGTFLNGERVSGHRVLKDRDALLFGMTHVRFRDPGPKQSSTVASAHHVAVLRMSPAQRKVLIALCRPYKDRPPFARPASNQDIAAELVIGVESVRTHMRALFATFEIDELPPHEKRGRLVEEAFVCGAVRDSDLEDEPPRR